MSDLDNFKQLFEQHNIGFDMEPTDTEVVLILYAGIKNVEGNFGHYAEFSFDHDGNFLMTNLGSDQ